MQLSIYIMRKLTNYAETMRKNCEIYEKFGRLWKIIKPLYLVKQQITQSHKAPEVFRK